MPNFPKMPEESFLKTKTSEKPPIEIDEDGKLLAIPVKWIREQPSAQAGDTFECQRCGEVHTLLDGSDYFGAENTKRYGITVYHCMGVLQLGGLLGHLVAYAGPSMDPLHWAQNLMHEFLSIMGEQLMALEAIMEHNIEEKKLILSNDDHATTQSYTVGGLRRFGWLARQFDLFLTTTVNLSEKEIAEIQNGQFSQVLDSPLSQSGKAPAPEGTTLVSLDLEKTKRGKQ